MGNNLVTNPVYARFLKEKHDDFPPEFGFKAPRKERVMQITEQEMKALNIHPSRRDYCAHLLREIYRCMNESAPFFAKCRHQNHAYTQCQVDDYILGLKEIERNRRLHERELKKQKMAKAH